MSQFFAGNYTGEAFELFGRAHIGALVVLFVFNLLLIQFKDSGEKVKHNIRWALASVLFANEVALHIWNLAVGKWSIQTHLPLHLCSLLVWAGALMLVTKNYRIYEFVYLLGIGGAIQVLATPDLDVYGFPHFRFFQTFIAHGLIVTSAVYMTAVEGFRPQWKSLGRVFLWANLYMLVIFPINIAIGSNYLMINHKPTRPSILDLLPPWPHYILYMEAIGLITILLLYLPFGIRDWKSRFAAAPDPSARREGNSN